MISVFPFPKTQTVIYFKPHTLSNSELRLANNSGTTLLPVLTWYKCFVANLGFHTVVHIREQRTCLLKTLYTF